MKKNLFLEPQGFSLIELLISLIIISVIVASFAPVLSKKLVRGSISISQGSKKNLTTDCPVHSNCMLCYEDEKDASCLVCVASCGDGEYTDRQNCSCISCSGRFSGCYTCTASRCTRCNSGWGMTASGCEYCGAGKASDGTTACINCNGARQYSLAGATSCSECPTGQQPNSTHTGCENITCPDGKYLENNTCQNCSNGCKKCTSASNCEECDSGYKKINAECKLYKTPKSQEDCNRATNNTTIYIPYSITNPSNKGFCMHKRNAGDFNGPSIDFGTDILKVLEARKTTASCPNADTKCCWFGYSGRSDKTQVITANNGSGMCSTTPSGWTVSAGKQKFDYEGCKRTVCNLAAAEHICKYYTTNSTDAGDWELPDKTDLEALAAIIKQEPQTKKDPATTIQVQRFAGADGLQLCQAAGVAADTFGSARCELGTAGTLCNGASSGNCYIHYVWGKGVEMNFSSSTPNVSTFDTASRRNYAQSVRCVLKAYVE